MGVIGRRGRRTQSAKATPGEVVVAIDRLLLDGLGSLDREAVGRAVEAALADHLTTVRVSDWGSGVSIDRLDASMRLEPVGRQHSSTIGGRIAGSVHGAVADAMSGRLSGIGPGRDGPASKA